MNESNNAERYKDLFQEILISFLIPKIFEEMNSDILIVLTYCNINFFKQRQKGVVSTGKCEVLRRGDLLIFKSERTNLQIPKNRGLIRLAEINYTTYLHIVDNVGVYSISCLNTDPLNQTLFNLLKNHIEVHDYPQIKPESELHKKLIIEVPIGQPGTIQIGATNQQKIKQIGEGVGGVFGSASNALNLDNANKQINASIATTVGQKNMSGWERFKKNFSDINDKVNQAFKPINDKCKQIVDGIGQSFDQSDNSFVKGVRDFSRKTQETFNSGYDKADAPRKVQIVQPKQQIIVITQQKRPGPELQTKIVVHQAPQVHEQYKIEVTNQHQPPSHQVQVQVQGQKPPGQQVPPQQQVQGQKPPGQQVPPQQQVQGQKPPGQQVPPQQQVQGQKPPGQQVPPQQQVQGQKPPGQQVPPQQQVQGQKPPGQQVPPQQQVQGQKPLGQQVPPQQQVQGQKPPGQQVPPQQQVQGQKPPGQQVPPQQQQVQGQKPPGQQVPPQQSQKPPGQI